MEPLRRSLAIALFGAVLLVGCGGDDARAIETMRTTRAIQGGMDDTTHTFAVAILQLTDFMNGQVSFCSGALLGPNLVATARHCIAPAGPFAIQCKLSDLGDNVDISKVLVTTDAHITGNGHFTGVSAIVTPSGVGTKKFCGNDLALLILSKNIDLDTYVIPAINPPMTDTKAYATSFAAIGYGVSTPADTGGTTAGVRRIKESVPIHCIPNDKSFTDCLSDPANADVLTANEFIGGDGSTCEGDSGANAFDQMSFGMGKWVSFGVLSRAGTSGDGTTCVGPVYERFDAWGALLAGTATRAAAMGGYQAPAWTATARNVDAGTSDSGTSSKGCGCSAAGDRRTRGGCAILSVVLLMSLRLRFGRARSLGRAHLRDPIRSRDAAHP
jgi:hypothetical protein